MNPSQLPSRPAHPSRPAPVPHNDQSALRSLASEIAAALDQSDRSAEFERLCATTDHSRIKSALKKVRNTPADKIKKSKAALFFYLLKQDAHEEE